MRFTYEEWSNYKDVWDSYDVYRIHIINEDDIEYFIEDKNYIEFIGLFLTSNAEYPEEKIIKEFAYKRKKIK